ncbi:MAG: S41 family peptidase [Chlamydiales bacterium]|nr:S41 family peptidase [Chlamydiales bacterium]
MIPRIFKYFFLFLLVISIGVNGAELLPELSSKDVKKKLNEIMSAHAEYKKLESKLVQRALQEFINEMDSTKTYLTEPEIEKWTSPSSKVVDQVLEEYNQGEYDTFKEIFQQMVRAIERRNRLEEDIKNIELPKGVLISEFKDMSWVKSEEELKDRLTKVKALQLETAAKLSEESKEVTLQRILKRRAKREDEFLTTNEKDRENFTYALILKATTAALDSHTSYFTPSEAEQFLIQVQQKLLGLGVQIRDDLNGFTVVKVLEGGPAFQGKLLKAKDKIVAVDNEPVVGLDIVEVVELLRGPNATSVVLTVLRESEEDGKKRDEKLDIAVKRGEVILKDTRIESSFMPFGDGGIGYIKLYSFYQDQHDSSSADVARIIEEFKAQNNLKGILLDLRSNPGGLLPQAVAVTGLFINKGVIVSVKHSDGKIQHLRDLEGDIVWNGPLVVLTNKLSASAAEIVVQTLQDYGRAIIVGDEHTFGKGTFQTFTLDTIGRAKVNSEGEYKVTRGKYYTVSGKSPQLVGASADVVVPSLFAYEEVGEKYTTYPLENDSIAPHFEDDFSDVSGLIFQQLSWIYRTKMQQRMTSYNQHIPRLVSNSKQRVDSNKHYKNLMEKLEKSHVSLDLFDEDELPDFQCEEAFNVTKDLIVLEASVA